MTGVQTCALPISGESLTRVARHVMDGIDIRLFHRVLQLQAYAEEMARKEELLESNQEFAQLDNRDRKSVV